MDTQKSVCVELGRWSFRKDKSTRKLCLEHTVETSSYDRKHKVVASTWHWPGTFYSVRTLVPTDVKVDSLGVVVRVSGRLYRLKWAKLQLSSREDFTGVAKSCVGLTIW